MVSQENAHARNRAHERDDTKGVWSTIDQVTKHVDDVTVAGGGGIERLVQRVDVAVDIGCDVDRHARLLQAC